MANELRLLFDKTDGAPAVRLVPHAGGGTDAAVPFEVALSEDDYEDLRWYLESYMDLPDGGSVVRARRIEQQLRTWGRTLYDALFDRGEHRELLLELMDGAASRLLTVATQDPDLLGLPLEVIADRRAALAQLAEAPPPFASLASFLRGLASGVPRRLQDPEGLGFGTPDSVRRDMVAG